MQESAEGIVDGQSGKAIEALQSRKGQLTDRPNRKAAVEGPNRIQEEYVQEDANRRPTLGWPAIRQDSNLNDIRPVRKLHQHNAG